MIARVLLLFALAPAAARAETVIRLASIAPEGTAWARELKAFAREVQVDTHDAVKVKWYLGAIAGNEAEVGTRVARQQLDGVASGGMMCERVMKSLRVTRIAGLFQSRDEASFTLARLTHTLEEEARGAGYTLLGTGELGPSVVFTRTPVRSVDELKRLRLWRWDLDEVGTLMSRSIGFEIVSLPVETASRAFDEGKIDGFIAIPTATLAFQWFTRARHLLDLKIDYLQGCVLVANRAFDKLTVEQQQAIRASGAKLSVRIGDVVKQTDEALLGGVFAQSGVSVRAAGEPLRTHFAASAREARTKLADQLAPAPLIERVLTILADYRADHEEKRKQ